MPETTRHTQDVLIDFEHHQTAHCESGATSGLLRFHGLELSEPMAFGIGGGLFFGYFPFMQLAHVRVTTFRKLPGTVICKAFKRLNMRYHSETFFRRGRHAGQTGDTYNLRLMSKGGGIREPKRRRSPEPSPPTRHVLPDQTHLH